MNVSHTRITFSGPIIAPKHRVATEFGGGILVYPYTDSIDAQDMFIHASFEGIKGGQAAAITAAYRHILKEVYVLFTAKFLILLERPLCWAKI